MKHNMKTILTHEMKVANNPNEAFCFGEEYFREVEKETYKGLQKEHLTVILRSASTLQMETGHICLFKDPAMPFDARVDIIHKPSYAVAAVGIYAMQTYPEVFDDELNRFFHDLLEGAFRYGVVGHGIEASELVRRTMLMLCKAGLRNFLAAHHKEFPTFSKVMQNHMAHFMETSRKIDEEGIVVTADGFSTESINHLIKELVAYWNGNTRSVFVYGTLMRGEHANWKLSGGEFAGFFLLKNFVMYNLGSFPGIKPCVGESVFGELYFVSPETIARLDEYEVEGSLYLRKTVQLQTGYKKFAAETYIYNGDVAGHTKIREAWNSCDDDLVWYAGYGSNLSGERFACYISGGTCIENGRTYPGSSDPTPPLAEKRCAYHGRLYFGNNSTSWGGCGVAFFDPNPKNKDSLVYMKRYLITRRQLHDVMAQEGQSANWYGRLVCLEVDNLGVPVYTLTSETPRVENAPSSAYVELIARVLRDEFKLGKKQVDRYLDRRS